jgi:hypothetical protein
MMFQRRGNDAGTSRNDCSGEHHQREFIVAHLGMVAKCRKDFCIMANKLNMAIAKTHRFSSRLVGMQITTGNLIGVILSATQMSVGFEVLAQGVTHGNIPGDVGIAIIGIALAILVERLSLTGLAGVRVTSEHKQRLEDAWYELRKNREPSEVETEDHLRLLKKYKRDGWKSVVFSTLGILLSAAIGDQFWHLLFAKMGIWGVILSLACAAVISLTFLHSELYKSLVDGVLKEILADLHLQKVAVAAEEQVMQVDMMMEAYDDVRNDDERYYQAKDKMKKVIGRRLGNFANHAANVGYEIDMINAPGQQFVEGSISYPAQKMLPSPRNKYAYHREELVRLLRANPALVQRDIAKHFGVSASTANDWLRKVRAGV